MFLYLLLCICLIFYSIYRYIDKRNNKLIPTIHNALSLWEIGIYRINLKDLFKRIMYLGKRTNENGGVSKFICGPLVIYVITSPEDAFTVTYRCMEKVFVYSMIKPFVGSELVAASVPVWKCNRRFTDLAFKQNILDGYWELFNTQGKRLTRAMGDEVNKEFDFTEIIAKNTLETVCQTTMGVNVNGEDLTTESYVEAINNVLEIMTKRVMYPWLMADFIFSLSSLKEAQDENLKIIWSLSDQMVKLRKAEYKNRLKNKHNKDYNDNDLRSYLDIVIENTVSEDHEALNDLQIRNLVDNMLLAGFDTSAPQILYTLINIGSYPDVQRKVYEEVISVIGDEDRSIYKDDLKKMIYLEAVLKETLRLYPVGAIVGRTTTDAVQLKNYVLPADCHVIVHIWAINRNKSYWGQDADDFRPERWLVDSVPSHPAAFASFSLGRRNCVGKSYGMALLKIIVAHVVRKYKITADNKELELEYAVLLKPSSGHLLRLEKRING